jgi:hypothetical protein
MASESRRRFSVPANRSSRPGAAHSTPAGPGRAAAAAEPAAAGGGGFKAGGAGAEAVLQGMCPSCRSCRRSAADCRAGAGELLADSDLWRRYGRVGGGVRR